MPCTSVLIRIDAELRIPEVLNHTAERLSLNDNLVRLVGKIGKDLLLLERMLRVGVLHQD